MSKRGTGPSEKVVAAKIVRYLDALPDGHAHKIHGSPYGTVGEPDITACVAGRAVFVEVKRPGKTYTLTPHQERALRLWAESGAVAFVATSVEEVASRLAAENLLGYME